MFGVQARLSEVEYRKYTLRKLNSIHYDNYDQRIRWEGKFAHMRETGNVGWANFSVRISFAKLHYVSFHVEYGDSIKPFFRPTNEHVEFIKTN